MKIHTSSEIVRTGGYASARGSVGVGPSPLQAYRKWRIERATNDLFHSALEEIQKPLYIFLA